MAKGIRSIGRSSRTVWMGVFTLGGGLLLASSVALASTIFQQTAPSQPAQSSQTHPKEDSQYSRLPEGPGKATLIKVCSKCHSANNVIANGQDRQGWEDTITKMVGLGAAGSDEDFTEILEYLTKNFPPVTAKVNVNKATASELESQLGFTTKQAEDIVAYRTKSGNFKTAEDVKRVPEMNASDVDARRNRMTFQ